MADVPGLLPIAITLSHRTTGRPASTDLDHEGRRPPPALPVATHPRPLGEPATPRNRPSPTVSTAARARRGELAARPRRLLRRGREMLEVPRHRRQGRHDRPRPRPTSSSTATIPRSSATSASRASPSTPTTSARRRPSRRPRPDGRRSAPRGTPSSIGDKDGKSTTIGRDRGRGDEPASRSPPCPTGLLERCRAQARDLLTFLLTPELKPAPIHREGPRRRGRRPRSTACFRGPPRLDPKTWTPSLEDHAGRRAQGPRDRRARLSPLDGAMVGPPAAGRGRRGPHGATTGRRPTISPGPT